MSDMTARYPSAFRIAMVSIVFLIGGCTDLGDPVPPPVLSVSQRNPQIASGETLTITIAGGTPPFTILDKADSTKVRASIVGNSLTIHALAAGSSSIVVGDNGSPRQTITVNVIVVLFTVGQSSFNLFVGDSATTTLSGGALPYSFVSKGDTTRVRASISGVTLNLRALAAGSSTIIIGDNSVPRLTAMVGVNVTAPVSFSTQVQPIFTTTCVNAGCHPGNGAPFPLLAGVSYARLVNVQATNAPCAGLFRVKPFVADSSALYRRIVGTCGSQMPLGGTPLSDADQNTIRDWINQGAANN
jgi:hypothetical protein